MFYSLFAATSVVAHASVPSTMRSVRVEASTTCKAPDFSCLHVEIVTTPVPTPGQALILVNASSINPSDVDFVETGLGPGASEGTLGNDVSGVVVSCPDCTRLKVGDAVWGSPGKAMADYAVHDEADFGLKPSSLDLTAAATIPGVGLSSLFALKRTGAPWLKKNLTVVVTSGAGGTGFIAIQLAKAYGAAHVATATSSDNIALVKSLGADTVVDYHQQDMFDYLSDDSVDVVLDNFGANGTADRAMHAIRAGGMYLLLPHGQCYFNYTQGPPCLAKNPKKDVTQINFDSGPHFENKEESLAALDEMKSLFEAGWLTPHVEQSFSFDQIRGAYARSASGHVVGKIAVTTSCAHEEDAFDV